MACKSSAIYIFKIFLFLTIYIKSDSIKLYFGAVNRKNSSETGQQRLIVHRENIFINEGYEFNQTLNDIAVINLPAEIQFDEFIQPVGLPSPNQVIDNLEGMTSGFGHTQGMST